MRPAISCASIRTLKSGRPGRLLVIRLFVRGKEALGFCLPGVALFRDRSKAAAQGFYLSVKFAGIDCEFDALVLDFGQDLTKLGILDAYGEELGSALASVAHSAPDPDPDPTLSGAVRLAQPEIGIHRKPREELLGRLGGSPGAYDRVHDRLSALLIDPHLDAPTPRAAPSRILRRAKLRPE